MALGLSTYMADKFLDAFGNAVDFSAAAVFVKLHVGDPGAAGTANAAAETTRKAASFGPASGGAISNDAEVVWTNIAGSQDATHFSLWDAATSGNFLVSGTITANPYSAGDTYTIPAGDLDVTFTALAA